MNTVIFDLDDFLDETVRTRQNEQNEQNGAIAHALELLTEKPIKFPADFTRLPKLAKAIPGLKVNLFTIVGRTPPAAHPQAAREVCLAGLYSPRLHAPE